MLTPVAASSDTSFSTYGQPGIVLSAQRVEVLLSSTGVDPRILQEPSVSSGSRLDLLSLSGQLQLAQGLSVVETIGALLSVSRNQGEPLSDYADRIAEVIAKLSPTERLALQRALNQLMQGFTLRLLTEILKNPVGPDATRLALKLEAAAYLERDPVARQVVTSYRQNAGAEAQPPASGRSLPGGAIASAPARQIASAGGSAMEASPANPGDDAKQPLTRQNSDATSVETDRGGEAAKGARLGAPMTLLNSRTSAQPGIAAAPAPANTAVVGTDMPRQAAGFLPLTVSEETVPPQAVATAPETAVQAEARPDEQNSADAVLDDVTYDGPALARLVQAGGEPTIASAATRPQNAGQPVQQASASLPAPALMPVPEPVPVAWLSGLYADEGGASWLLANAAPQAMADAADAPAAHAFDGMAAGEKEGLPESLGIATASTPLPAAAAHTTGAQASAAMLTPAQQAAALQALAAQGLLVREGVMPAYVPYPAPGGIDEKPKPLVPAVEPDDEHRERGRRSGRDPDTGENGQDEQMPAEAETAMAGEVAREPAVFGQHAGEQDIAHTAPAIGDDAQAYYQRMAGW